MSLDGLNGTEMERKGGGCYQGSLNHFMVWIWLVYGVLLSLRPSNNIISTSYWTNWLIRTENPFQNFRNQTFFSFSLVIRIFSFWWAFAISRCNLRKHATLNWESKEKKKKANSWPNALPKSRIKTDNITNRVTCIYWTEITDLSLLTHLINTINLVLWLLQKKEKSGALTGIIGVHLSLRTGQPLLFLLFFALISFTEEIFLLQLYFNFFILLFTF
jgi:hypothetical protein